VFHLRNRTVSAKTTAAGIHDLQRFSAQTVRNRLHQRGIRPKRPYVEPVVTQVHRRARVHWCHTLMVWFSDESRFLLQRCDGRTRVYRRRNERFTPVCYKDDSLQPHMLNVIDRRRKLFLPDNVRP
jgi:hypothetical protein